MKHYVISLHLDCTYDIDAPNEELALDKAMEYFSEAEPAWIIDEVDDDE